MCHYPTGASKWNWGEHRLFSAISANWAGEPLTSYTKMLNFLEATTTQQGSVVKAILCETHYQTGLKISDEQMDCLNLYQHDTLPQWNYTVRLSGCLVPVRKSEVIILHRPSPLFSFDVLPESRAIALMFLC